MRMARWSLVLGAISIGACGPPAGMVDAGNDTPRDAGPADITLGGERPARMILPFEHDGTTPRPLIVLLHGYSASGAIQDGYFDLSDRARARGMYVVLPNGTEDSDRQRFWNATDACCNFGGSDVDDVAYLTGLLDEAAERVPVDPTRVYFMGHSNGGFMSYRMACEIGSRIAAIATLAGSDYDDETECVPDSAPSVLHIHGSADETIAYEGSSVGLAPFPGAVEVVERWATRAGCDATMSTPGTALDIDSSRPGAETVVADYTAGCTEGRSASLWTLDSSGHIPPWSASVGTEAVLDWLLAHHR
jgi:polyhydroxybutyrate depolymerase